GRSPARRGAGARTRSASPRSASSARTRSSRWRDLGAAPPGSGRKGAFAGFAGGLSVRRLSRGGFNSQPSPYGVGGFCHTGPWPATATASGPLQPRRLARLVAAEVRQVAQVALGAAGIVD